MRITSIVLFFVSLIVFTHASVNPALASHSPITIDVRHFGAIPNDGMNDAGPIRKALQEARRQPGATVYFAPGVYDFYDTDAVLIEQNALMGRYGEDVQGVLFRPEAPYVIGLDLEGARDVTILADGATLMFEGWYEAVSLHKAQNVTIRGLAIDYKRPPHTVGRIVEKREGSFDMRFDPTLYSHLDSVVTGRIHFYDTVRERFYSHGSDEGKQRLNDSTIRVFSSSNAPLGDLCILRHSAHYRAGILVKQSDNIALINVKIHNQPGMGVVGHRSHNILMDNIQVIPRPGSVMSTNTDATHFTSCTGKISLHNCKFAGQGDDCTNIHNYYYSIYPVAGKTKSVEIAIENADLHALSLDFPDVADTLLLVDRYTLEPIDQFRVVDFDTSEADWRVTVELDRAFAYDEDKYFMTNNTRRPAVEIVNNTVRSHLARAYLIKARNVVIRGNTIQQSSGTAIQLGAELNWRESGPVENVLIEDNYIINSGYGQGTQDGTAINVDVSSVKSIPPLLNKNIIIRNNIIQAVGKRAIYVRGARNVQILNNKIDGVSEPVVIEHSEDYVIE